LRNPHSKVDKGGGAYGAGLGADEDADVARLGGEVEHDEVTLDKE